MKICEFCECPLTSATYLAVNCIRILSGHAEAAADGVGPPLTQAECESVEDRLELLRDILALLECEVTVEVLRDRVARAVLR